MNKSIYLLFATTLFFIVSEQIWAQDSIINEKLKAREIEFQLLKKYQDSLKIRTLNNLIVISNQQKRLILADSALIATMVEEIAKTYAGQDPKQLLDTIQRLKGRIEYLKLAPPYRGKFMSPKDYLVLLGLSFLMVMAGIFALLVLRRANKAKSRVQQIENTANEAVNKQNECEKRLEEFNQMLNQVSEDRRRLMEQISELNKSILSSRQDQIILLEERDKFMIENQELKREVEKLRNQPTQVSQPAPSFPPTELITENNLLKSENMQAKQTILRLEEEVNRLKKALEERPEAENSDTENLNKYRLELQKAQQMLVQTQDKLREMDERNKFLASEKDRLSSELNISMQSVKSLRDRLENIERECLHLRNEKQDLEQKLENIKTQYTQIDTLNNEIIRWKNENERLQQMLAQEMKLRKDIESDIQKLLGRIGGGNL
ncbi:MAG: hypothetical protein ACP5O2_07955 [Bacteroidales bacterium]